MIRELKRIIEGALCSDDYPEPDSTFRFDSVAEKPWLKDDEEEETPERPVVILSPIPRV